MASTGEPFTILVTGGTGLVGMAIHTVVEKEPQENERFVFLSSKVAYILIRCVILFRAYL